MLAALRAGKAARAPLPAGLWLMTDLPEVVREGKMIAHIYQTDDGHFVVADQAGWFPGSYGTRDAALAAIREANGLT